MRTQKKQQKENPSDTANIFSKFTFWWMKDFFKLGLKGSIPPEEVYKPKSALESEPITKKFAELWSEELKKENPNVLRVVFNIYGFQLICLGIVFPIVETTMRILQPFCLGGLVSYFAPCQIHITKSDAYLYAGGIVLASAASTLTFHPYLLYLMEMGAKVRLGCSGLIYRKTLRLSKSAVYDGLNGKVINLIANDMSRFELALGFLHDVWKAPIEAVLIGYFIYQQIGIASVIGMAFLFTFIPIQVYITKKSAQFRLKAAKRTDFRIKIMNEIILGIQVIKMYAWEKSFAGMVDRIRKKEVSAIRGTAYLRATLVSFGTISRLSIFISLVTYVYFGNIITAQQIFIVFSFFNYLNMSLLYLWPLALTSVADGYISVKRVQEFLLVSERKPQYLAEGVEKKPDSHHEVIKQHQRNDAPITKKSLLDTDEETAIPKRTIYFDDKTKKIVMKNVTAVWETGHEKASGIYSIDLVVKERELCAVVGPVGCSKSTLLTVLIGDLDVDIGDCKINGSISYASQEPWLFEGTVRSNIIFVEQFDQSRYKEVVRVCGLERDFQLMPNGDETIIGERGISLSGGQKARVNLARAVYKEADIYLLDDPLSAVDSNVGKHIFQECIQKFLGNKCCILVTHQLQYLKDVEHLVLMYHGRIECQGSYEEVRKRSMESFLTLQSPDETGNEVAESNVPFLSTIPLTERSHSNEKDEREETQAVGAVNPSVYSSYITAVNSFLNVGLVVALFICAQGFISGVDYYISQWSNWEEQVASAKTTISLDFETTLNNCSGTDAIYNGDENEERTIHIITYASLMGAAICVFVYRTFAFFSMCLKASIKLHESLFRGISRATMYFYNNNPSGRILNRFSKDINNVDTLLPSSLLDCITFFMEFTATMVIVILANYWLLIPIFVMTIVFYVLRYIYINTARSIKRLEALTQSPIYSHANATLQGLSTIRSTHNARHILETEFYELEDDHTGAFHLRCLTNRAFAFWLDVVCLVFIVFVTFSFIVFDSGNTKSGNIGLAILYCINLVGMCQYGIRQTAEVESQMTSVERIVEYSEIPSEPELESELKYCPPTNWPSNGDITLKELSFKYSANGNYVLKNLNLSIRGNEKVGIVGRTGAGKSSIVQAIFRLAELDGEIIIDGIVTNTLGLHDLRKNISIIPQDPVLFSGSLRFNLDPFDEHNDQKIWNALELVELKSFVSSLAGGLNSKVMDGGSNFSMGQRQLVCLARAILRNNKILICDEATANVDPETDKLIQTTIRNKFANCTVLTIAHRLHTVMDSDRVLVIDAGVAVEFDHPFQLLQKPNGHLRHLVEQTGSATAEILTHIAAESFANN